MLVFLGSAAPFSIVGFFSMSSNITQLVHLLHHANKSIEMLLIKLLCDYQWFTLLNGLLTFEMLNLHLIIREKLWNG